jgi:hypothetical protein
VRDMNLPPSLLGSGRRIGAGPGLRPATAEGFGRASATTLEVGCVLVAFALATRVFATREL